MLQLTQTHSNIFKYIMRTCDMIWNDLMGIEYSKALMKHYNNFYFWGEF